MKNNKIEITKDIILEFDEKSFSDINQIIKNYNEDSFKQEIEKYSSYNKEDLERSSMIYFKKGKKLWLELDIEDSYTSSMLMSWLYSKSKFDDTNGLRIFGSKLNTIFFEKPSGYSDDEKNAIKTLYNKMIGDEKDY